MDRIVSIMLVEDQKLFREGILKLVEPRDNVILVGEADNGAYLFKLLKIKIPDVILLDLEMPQMNGSETLDMLKKMFPEIKVIICTQYDDETLIKDLFNRGANAYIPKDTDWGIIVEAIHAVKTKGFYMDNIPGLNGLKLKKIPYFKLLYSKREREIIRLMCDGDQINDISEKLSIAPKTIETNLTEIYKKAGVKNKGEFLICAVREGLNYIGT